MLGVTQLESSLAEERLEVLMDTRLNMSQQRDFYHKEGQRYPGLQ